MPRNAAVVRLKALIDALPREPATDISAGTIATDLLALLPRDKLNVRSPDRVFATVRPGQTQIVMALSAFVIMLFIAFLLSAILSAGPGYGANPGEPRSENASTNMPRR
jgi:hypothetical protein